MDIAGLVRGASKGEGPGNKFLANIREVDAVVMVLRCFEDENISHVEGSIDPIRDAETVMTELLLADLESIERQIDLIEKRARQGDKEAKQRFAVMEPVLEACAKASRPAPPRSLPGAGDFSPVQPADRKAGALCLQRRGRKRRRRQ